MPVKRKDKLEKRQRKRLKRAKSTPTISFQENPYPYVSAEAMEEDIDLLQHAWEAHYGELPDDFMPPFFEESEEGLKMAAWAETFRSLLLEKYIVIEVVEPRFKFIFFHIFSTALRL
jgi:hypothetical protein